MYDSRGFKINTYAKPTLSASEVSAQQQRDIANENANRGYQATTTYQAPTGNTDNNGGGSGRTGSSSATPVSGEAFDLAGYLEAIRAQQRADAEAAYARARNALNSAYSEASSAYGNIYNRGADQLGRSYSNSRGKINTEAEDAFRQAYVNRMMSEKNLGQRLAAMGMSGGAAESTMAGLINNYGNARSGIQRTLDTNLGDLEMKYQGNLADLYNAYQQNMANIASQRANQLSTLEMQLANLNANMGGDYYSAMLSNVGNLQKLANSAVASQAAYSAPVAQEVTNTFTPANVQQANDVGAALTNYGRKKFEEDLAAASAGTKDPNIIAQTMYAKGYTPADLFGYV